MRHGQYRSAATHTTYSSAPRSDQQLDVGVMVGLYGIFVIVESAALVKVILHPSRDAGDEAHKV